MKYCSKHHCNLNNAVFCSECGEKLEEAQINKFKKCPKCKEKNPLDASFCHKCGTNLEICYSRQYSQARSTSTSNVNSNNKISNSNSTRLSTRSLFRFSSIMNGKVYTWALTLVTSISIGSIFLSIGYVTVYDGYVYDWLFLLITSIISIAMYRSMLNDKRKVFWIWKIIIPLNILAFIGCGTNMSNIFKVELSIFYYVALVIFIIGYITVLNKVKS